MSQPKVSVIIPVYNSEKYLRRCLDSVTGQTLHDIEIICIDDGSTDESTKIINEYIINDSRVKFIKNKQNYGPGYSRNKGIKKACGEFIGFIDSDDYPNEDFFEILYNLAKENKADIVKGVYNYTHIARYNGDLNEKIKLNKNYFFGEFCSAIISTSLIKDKNILFPERYDMEDPVFSFKCAIIANKIIVNNEAIVNIVRRNDSVSSFESISGAKKNRLKISDRISGCKELYSIANINKIDADIYGYMISCFIELIFSNLSCLDIETKDFFSKEFYNFWLKVQNRKCIIKHIKCELLSKILNKPTIESFFYYDKTKELKKVSAKNLELLSSNNILEKNFKDIIDKYYKKILCNDTKNTIDIVTVVNNFDIYNKCIGDNKFISNRNNIRINTIDNSTNNKFISVRYNEFIKSIFDDNWILFCHCDWEILEDIIPRLKELDKNCLYGPIGSKCETLYEENNTDYVVRELVGSCLERRRDGSGLRRLGNSEEKFKPVDTFDCQALLVHSSLIKKYNLLFDENLQFDLYVEDFCISSFLKYGIKSYSFNITCCHWSGYHITPNSYYKSLSYINDKYKKFLFSGTVSLIGSKNHKEIYRNALLVKIRNQVKSSMNQLNNNR